MFQRIETEESMQNILHIYSINQRFICDFINAKVVNLFDVKKFRPNCNSFGKLTSSKWAKITKTSADAALRDIKDLMEKDILQQEEAGRMRITHVEMLRHTGFSSL